MTTIDACRPSALELAAKAGMIVKLHVNDGCDNETEIPVKNLLQVNQRKEILSNKASYVNLRHCALSQLFKYEPEGKIPIYAWRNFITHFTYYQAPTAHDPTTPLKKYQIETGEALTRVLEEASMTQLVEENENVILHIHCDFENKFKFDEGEKFRKEATAAADNVVKTLKDWIKKASTFVSNHANKLSAHDYVVVSKDVSKGGSKSNSFNKEEYTPMEWATRFVEVLLVPETRREGGNPNDLSSWTSVPSKKRHHHVTPEDLMVQYEETLDNLAGSVVKGLQCASKFILHVVQDLEKSYNSDDVLSLSHSPSLVESISSTSSSQYEDSNEDDIVEQGVEIVIDEEMAKTNSGSEEWKIFFGKDGSVDDAAAVDDAVVINHKCNSEVVSLSSSEKEDGDDMSSFADVSDNQSEGDNASWAMLSDEE